MIRFIIGMSLLISLSSCDSSLEKVHVGTTPFFGEAAFHIAQTNGFFEDYGLEVVSHSNPAGKESLKELYNGKLDIAHTAELPIVYALLHSPAYKGDIIPKICANMIHNRNMQKIIACKDRGINSPKDLRNKRIGYFEGTTSEFFLDTFLIEHGVPESTVEKKNINVLHQLEALQKGKVDAVVSWEPHATKILTRLKEKTVELNTMIDHSTLWLIVSSSSYISENPKIIEAYLQALKEAQEYIKRNPAETQKLLARRTQVSQDIIAKLWPTIDYELSLGEHMLFLMEDEQRWLQNKGYFEGTDKNIDFEKYIYFEALETVHPQGITIIR